MKLFFCRLMINWLLLNQCWELLFFCKAISFIFHFFFNFYFYFILLYNTVLLLPYIDMNLPQVYMCSQSWTPLPPPSPYHLSGSSQYTSPKQPVPCIEPRLAIRFLYDIIHVSVTFMFLCVHLLCNSFIILHWLLPSLTYPTYQIPFTPPSFIRQVPW